MSEGANLAVGTKGFERSLVVRIDRLFSGSKMFFTEFAFVAARMVELFDFVMGAFAVGVQARPS